MRSFRSLKDGRRRIFLALAGSVESKIRDLYAKRNEAGIINQSILADKIGINRSAVHRRLNGGENMTLKTIADMIWALDGCIEIDIFDPADRPERNNIIGDEYIDHNVNKSFGAGEWGNVAKSNVTVRSDAQLVVTS